MSLFRKTKSAVETEAEAKLEASFADHQNSTRINCLEPRQLVEIVGRVEHVCSRSLDGVPAFEIEVSDGTGSLVALWTGRKSIACIERGTRVALWGRAAPMRRENSLVVYNPRYELLP
jgi:RecG-like helicase